MAGYKKEQLTSYTLGITLTIELLKTMPEIVKRVYFHSDFDGEGKTKIISICREKKIEIIESNKIFNALNVKENCFVIGEFQKFEKPLNAGNQLVLVSPSDAGNIGTIMRSALGFGVVNLVIIKPAVDIFNPKAVRSSMGAIFHLNIKYYDSFNDYLKDYKNVNMYPFMLKAEQSLNELTEEIPKPYALIFGNEATGLSDDFLKVGTPLIIKHSKMIDSLNLPIAVSIGLYEVTKRG